MTAIGGGLNWSAQHTNLLARWSVGHETATSHLLLGGSAVVVEGHIIRKTADIQFGVEMTVRIAATDEHSVSTVNTHVGQRQGLVVKQEVRDCLGHGLSERERGQSANNAIGW